MRKKVVIVLIIFGIIITSLVAAIATVLVAMLTRVSASISVGYNSKHVDVNVTARYWTGASDWQNIGAPNGLTFNSKGASDESGELNPNGSISMEGEDNKIVFEYAFINKSDNIYLNLDLLESPEASGMDVSFYISPTKINNAKYLQTLWDIEEWNSQTIAPTGTKSLYVYIVAQVQENVYRASYNGNFDWNLQVPNEYAVIYDVTGIKNYQDFAGTKIAMQGIPFKSLDSIPKASAVGKVFGGWYLDENFTQQYISGSYVNSNINLYPKFLEGNVGVVYNTTANAYVVNDFTSSGSTEIIIPDTTIVDGETVPVSSINTTLPTTTTAVYVGGNIETIPANFAKNCTNLTEVVIGSNVDTISDAAFYGCTSLTSISIPGNVTTIGKDVFKNCSSLEEITLAEGVETINSGAFLSCTKLQSLTLPESIKSIGQSVFQYCDALLSLYIPKGLESIGKYAFNYAPNLQSIVVSEENPVYTSGDNCNAIMNKQMTNFIKGCNNSYIPDGIKTIEYLAFNSAKALTSITIPQSVKIIFGYAFCDTGLMEVVLPSNLTRLGERVFSYCPNLKELVIPKTCTSIGIELFWESQAIEKISVESGNTVYDSRNNCNAIIETATNKLIQGCPNTVIVDGINIIGKSAMGSFSAIKEVYLPDSVVEVQDNAFTACRYLDSVRLSNNLQRIGDGAFSSFYHGSFNNVTIPASVTYIGKEAFWGDPLLKVTFENTTGWQMSSSAALANPIAIDVTNASTNATNLRQNGSWCPMYLFR